jgi:chemotaxis protein MotB
MRRALTAALALVALASTGCVAKSDYLRKEAEAAQLRKDWLDELEKAKAVREQFAALRGEVDGVQAEARGLAEKVRVTEGNLAAKQGELNALSARYAEQQALVDELSKSKKKLEAAKAELEKKSAEYQQLATSLQGDIEAGRVELSELKGRLTVKMKDKILFASGSATIGKEGLAALAKVADALRDVTGKVIRIEGHTDDVPTGGGAFPTNWELSTARALAVVRYFQEKNVDPTRLAAAGYGEFQPIAGNDTPEGRSLNRRIEIVLAAAAGAP